MWLFGTLTALTLLFFLINYANVLRWQVRAQSAADAAASGAISVQSTQWNQMLVLLYSSSIEEWRIRRLLDMMLLTLRGSGGCGAAGWNLCVQDYAKMYDAYQKAVQRYTVDVTLMQRVSSATFSDYSNDARHLVDLFARNCGATTGGDCAFSYTLNDFSPRASGLQDVQQDGLGFWIGGGTTATVKQDLQPAQLEVVVCHDVPPLIHNFFGLQFGNFRAIGRAAATTVLTTQEWLQPGSITNPWSAAPFQTTEYYDADGVAGVSSDWYMVDFSGNDTQTFTQYGAINEAIRVNEFTTFTGWWSSVPVRPYRGTLPADPVCS